MPLIAALAVKMKFRLSHSYIDQKARQPIYGIVIWSAILLGFGVFAYSHATQSGVFLAVAFLALTLVMVIPAWKQRRFWQKYGASIEVEVTPNGIIQKGADGQSVIQKEAIESVFIQENRKGISSLFFQSQTGASGKLEGYENIEQLASAIEGLVGSEKLRRKRWLHR